LLFGRFGGILVGCDVALPDLVLQLVLYDVVLRSRYFLLGRLLGRLGVDVATHRHWRSVLVEIHGLLIGTRVLIEPDLGTTD
jgi:sulfite exporter TauE/SafE